MKISAGPSIRNIPRPSQVTEGLDDRKDRAGPAKRNLTRMKAREANCRYVQYGCGCSAPVEWRNFDASPRLRFERLPLPRFLYGKYKFLFPQNVEYGDIVKGLPLAPASCEGMYCSHVLEHLSMEDATTALRHTFRYLRPGGIFRLVLPDLEYIITQYRGAHSKDAAPAFMRETGLGHEHRPRSLKAFIALWLGHSQHRWMWDYAAMESALQKAGFVDIRRAFRGDSVDPMFGMVEVKERWDNCLGVECRKPT